MSSQTVIGHTLMHAAGEAASCAMAAAKYVSGVLAPMALPSVNELITAHQRGWITDEQLTQTARLHCVALDVTASGPDPVSDAAYAQFFGLWTDMWYASQELPTKGEYLEIANRYFYADKSLDEGLKRYGFVDDVLRGKVANLRYDIPGPADLVRFSIRHVWEPDLVSKLSYDAEFPGGIIDMWHAMKGLDYPLFTGPFAAQVTAHAGSPARYPTWPAAYAAFDLAEPTWAKAYWWSHWVLPSPTQGYQMWFKLDPLRDRKYDGPEMVGQDFDFDALALLLRANDYPQYYRPLLAAISRPVPGIRFAREFARNGVYDFKDLLEWARRQGYAPQDQQDIAKDIWAAAQKSARAGSCQMTCKLIGRLLRAGVLTQAEAEEALATQLDDPEEAKRQVAVALLEIQAEILEKVAATLRRQYLRGVVDDDQVRASLSQVGVAQERITGYLSQWRLERQTDYRQISAGKAVAWACKGLLSLADLQNRLGNLNYQQQDIASFLGEAQLCQQAAAAKAATDLQKAKDKAARDIIKAQKDAAAQLKELQRQLATHGSPPQLRKWYCEGHIGSAEVYGRLHFLGWPDIDIARLIGDCKQKPGP